MHVRENFESFPGKSFDRAARFYSRAARTYTPTSRLLQAIHKQPEQSGFDDDRIRESQGYFYCSTLNIAWYQQKYC